MPHYCWWYWRIYKRQDYANVERGLYVKIIHVNYEIFTRGSRPYPGGNVKRIFTVTYFLNGPLVGHRILTTSEGCASSTRASLEIK